MVTFHVATNPNSRANHVTWGIPATALSYCHHLGASDQTATCFCLFACVCFLSYWMINLLETSKTTCILIENLSFVSCLCFSHFTTTVYCHIFYTLLGSARTSYHSFQGRSGLSGRKVRHLSTCVLRISGFLSQILTVACQLPRIPPKPGGGFWGEGFKGVLGCKLLFPVFYRWVDESSRHGMHN